MAKVLTFSDLEKVFSIDYRGNTDINKNNDEETDAIQWCLYEMALVFSGLHM